MKREVEACINGQVHIVNSAKDPDMMDPLELVIDAEQQGQTYRYDVKLFYYGGVVYEETFVAVLPFDIVGSLEDVSSKEYSKFTTQLSQSKHPFKIRLKNGEITFDDYKGRGIFKRHNDFKDNFWTTGEEQSADVEAVGCLVNLASNSPRNDFDVQSKITTTFLNHLMIAEKVYDRLEGVNESLDSELLKTDAEFLASKLKELKRIYEILIEPLIPDLEKRLGPA